MRFILIDRILELEPGRRALARKTFAADEDFLADHFPGLPVVPGVLLTEAMAQTCSWLVSSTIHFERWPLLQMIEKAKFRHPVVPGEELLIEAVIESERATAFAVRAEIHAAGRRAAEARLVLHLLEPVAAGPAHDRLVAWSRRTFRELGGEALLGAVVGARA